MSEEAIGAHHSRSALPTLTAFRWWAAAVVFAFHLDAATRWLPVRAFGFGQAGVAFFFVLSGFVLTWSSHGRAVPARTFWRRRFARVYPTHLVVFLAVAALIAVVPDAPFLHSGSAAVANLTLTQAWSGQEDVVFSYDGPAWSLSVEAFFYLLFPLLLPRLRRMRSSTRVRWATSALAAGLSGTVVLALVGLGRDVAFPDPLVRLPEFVLGVTLALGMREGTVPHVPMRLAVAVLVLSAPVALVAPLFPLRDYVLLPAAALLVVAGASRDLRQPPHPRKSPAVHLGELSFAFYLIHLVVLQLLLDGPFRAVDWSPIGGLLPAALALALSLVLAEVLHHAVERPCQRLLSGGSTAGRGRAMA